MRLLCHLKAVLLTPLVEARLEALRVVPAWKKMAVGVAGLLGRACVKME